ncbi:MAG: protein kinase [Acidobacteria bacterium]|nr:protein kinase [Acidobacteriota bacterium]
MKVCPKCSTCYDESEITCSIDKEFLETAWPASRLIVGKYLLKSRLAEGGMGVIYRAIQSELNREVAVKILSPQLLSKERILKQFHREALAIARLDHINITPIYDYGALPSNYGAYLVMRLVHGKQLSAEIDDLGAFPLERALRIMQQICAGVSSAHTQQIIHCDLKPDNILIENCGTTREQVQIVDFGIAKLRELSVDGGNSAITDSAIGTPQYMSPEQCCGEPLTVQTDIYSLGIIFFEMVTGRVPFSGGVPVDIAQHHVRTPPPPPSRFRAGIPVALDYAILRALAKRPSSRPESVQQFFDELLHASGISLAPIVDVFTSGSFINLANLVVPAVATPMNYSTTKNLSSENKQINPATNVKNISESKQTSYSTGTKNLLDESKAQSQPVAIQTPGSVETYKNKNTRQYRNITSQLSDSKTNPFVNLKNEIKPPKPEQFFPEIMTLIVDENNITDTIDEILQDFGSTVILAKDSEEAWKCLEKYVFNLVITNVLTKQVNGWQLFARSQDLSEQPVFIFITDSPKDEDRLQALENGIEDYWSHPLPVAELQIRLRRLLQRISKELS